MNRSSFRKLVIVGLGLPLLGALAESVLLPDLVPKSLQDSFETYVRETPDTVQIMATGFAFLVALPCTLICVYGLLRFRRWAPRFVFWSTAASYLPLLVGAPILQSGFGFAMTGIAGMVWGAIIMLTYFDPETRAEFGLDSK